MMPWKFFADRGGTFTDIVAITPHNQIITHKLLSQNPERYEDAIVQGIRDILRLSPQDSLTSEEIEVIKIGTTVGTNALLERKGDRTVLVITKGFKDALRIGYQNRPDIFAREIILPELLYEAVIEVKERIDAQGHELIPLNLEQIKTDLIKIYQSGIRSCAIILMHGYRYPDHEKKVAKIAKEIGFTQISVSHQVSPLMKLISRGDTTVVDAYISPILRRYIDQVTDQLNNNEKSSIKMMFMQSNGGLTNANNFQGKDSLLSGPAGGIVGAVQTSLKAGFNKIITFDMGGTSTDVAHFNGEYERQFETEIAGIRMRVPMMAIHTVAAGGSSILQFKNNRYQVGPDSAGANPGPASYRRGGPLCITDANILLGKIQSQYFPAVFGLTGNLPLDSEIVRQKFIQLAQQIKTQTGNVFTPESVASGFIEIAVENMANAIKKISVQRGYDVSEYTLVCFGGAGGQHACLIAEKLGIQRIFIHPYAGVLSAYGIGLADIRVVKQYSVEKCLQTDNVEELKKVITELRLAAEQEIMASLENPPKDNFQIIIKARLKYQGTDSTLLIDFQEDIALMRLAFEQEHQLRYGFIQPHKNLIIDSLSVEIIQPIAIPEKPIISRSSQNVPHAIAEVKIFTKNQWYDTPVYQREDLQPDDQIIGPAMIVEKTGTNIIEPNWQATLTNRNSLILEPMNSKKILRKEAVEQILLKPDPVRLEIFKNLFQFIAEEMGITLQNTASSVNIKERLDFSCAIFDQHGDLVANAPHIPVHLGSMSASIHSLIEAVGNNLKKGDVYASNNPYNGGTHLPDITVITPVFNQTGTQILFYVASRGHHADIGGITPGSMPPNSHNITEEGVLIDNFQLIKQGQFQEPKLRELLINQTYPVRNLDQNIADLIAQVNANAKGVEELQRIVEHYGLFTVQAYMNFVQDHAEESVRRAIAVLKAGEFCYVMDGGEKIQVKITIDYQHRSAIIDFTGTSAQLKSNLNAPIAVCQAAVLYVFRTLVNENIPLNHGCLKPLTLIIPEGSMLNPSYPAAIVAGNVETSQAIVNALYGALGVMAASQGTMNNFTFGNEKYQYYETICGGSGAGATFAGTSAVQTQMTNSRLTDPEVLEWRFPVLLESFEIRPHSGGLGQFNGGDGVIRKIRFLESMKANILSGNRVIPPFGLNGGRSGQVGHNYLIRQDRSLEELGAIASVSMEAGDTFVIETPGGGGFGEPKVES
ncbi:MAG: 5-oxoprolinase [Snowella sp.]|nr:MAG: 5-oxoprolinase [Snowella sp.]